MGKKKKGKEKKGKWFSDEFGRSNGGPMMLGMGEDGRHVMIDEVS